MCPSCVDTCPLLTLLPDELQWSVRGQNGVEFCQEFNEIGPTRLSCVDMCPLLTLLPDELQGSVKGQNKVEFCQQFNQLGPRHVLCVCHMSTHVYY